MLFEKQIIDSISFGQQKIRALMLLIFYCFANAVALLWWLVTEQSTVGIDLVIGKVVVLRWSCLLLFYENFWCFVAYFHTGCWCSHPARCWKFWWFIWRIMCNSDRRYFKNRFVFLFLVVNLDMFPCLILYVPIDE